MKLSNTLTRKKDELTPLKAGEVGIYSCGPTVYWNQHIGHMYAYVQWDTLVRFLRWTGNKVTWVMNITDVGHMTSDEDAGEDKMEKGAKREGVSVWQIANKYIAQFLESLELLNIQKPDVLSRATEHITEQIELIKKIEERGFAYRTKTGLVFDTGKFPGYGDFARLDLEKQSAGVRVEVDPEKKNPWDFLLWVTNQLDHIMQWDSPWGRGFPGWHIECTAMSVKYLGEQFDIHTGGQEHIAVHHTNEIAQGFGAFGRQTAQYWVHNGWLTLKGGEKMSKSKGNFYTAQDVAAKGIEPLALRYLFLTSHYRKGLSFSWEALEGAATALKNLREMVASLKTQKEDRRDLAAEDMQKVDKFREEYTAALADDLNAAAALAVVWAAAKSNLPSRDKLDLMTEMDEVLGLKLSGDQASERSSEKEPREVQALVAKREALRQASKWVEADKVREEIERAGWAVEDSPEGTKVVRGEK